MAELLKNYIDSSFVNKLSSQISKHDKKFSPTQFTKYVLDSHWSSKELKQRIRHVSQIMGKCLSGTYPTQIKTLQKVAPEFSGLGGLIFPDFVEVFGQNDLETSLPALQFFTSFSSSEFAIRPFIKAHPELLMSILLEWSKHKNEHVRRLSSEGCRPRLPWSFPLRELQKDPKPVLKILNNLKNDDSLYVRKSVANNLNDISKDHPELVLKTANAWIGKSQNTDWILKHALRTLLKKGDQTALVLFGLGKIKNVKVTALNLSQKTFTIGSHLEFSTNILNKNKKDVSLRVEYAIHFLNKNGKHAKKVFKLSEKTCAPGDIFIQRRHSLKQMTTRTHNPGMHQLDIIVNGETQLSQKFTLKK
ncbi:MAG: DNA alkylation repair protein [Bdellovibrionaceae bacterium]|nr:DNA alkylation repair protein [Pseudobdellovibrionaceae bacterium]